MKHNFNKFQNHTNYHSYIIIKSIKILTFVCNEQLVIALSVATKKKEYDNYFKPSIAPMRLEIMTNSHL